MSKKNNKEQNSFLSVVLNFFNIIKNKPKWIIFLLLTIATLGSGYLYFTKSSNDKTKYQTTTLQKGSIVSSVSASGQVLSVNIMSANTKASGIVKTVFVKDGDVVQKGDKIMDIDLDLQGSQKNAQAWSSYLSAKNSLETAKATQYSLQADMFDKWDIFKELAESSTYEEEDETPKYAQRALPEFHIPEKEWLAAEKKYTIQKDVITQAQAAINSSWLDYQLTSSIITAPTNGVITSLMYSEGMSIGTLDTGSTQSNQKVATIQTQGTPVVSVNLSEIDVSKVDLGQKATVTLDSIADKTFTGTVIGVDRIGSTTSGVTQYPANIKLDLSASEILPNMTVTANIIIDKRDDVFLIPSSAVKNQDGQNFVEVLKDNQPQFVPVEVGLSSDTQIEIVSGLEENDLVVTGNSLSTNSQQNGSSPFDSSPMRMMRIAH